MDIPHAQEAFVQLLGGIKPEVKTKFLQWVNNEYSVDTAGNNIALEPISEENDGTLLDCIAADLRATVPLNCLAPEEPVYFPTRGQNADLSPSSTLHVDAFLYPTDEDVDNLCDQLGVGRNLCTECGSWKTKPIDFISHSMSREQLQYIFQYLLPDLRGKLIVDVGSRLGTVLWGGYVYSQAAKLIGVEKNSYFYELQCQVIMKYGLKDRVQLLCADVCNVPDLLKEADVIVLNNVFEFFCTPETQINIWNFLYTQLRRGTLLVTIPSILDSINALPFEVPIDASKWITEVPLTNTCVSDDQDLQNVHLYCVQ